MRCGNEIKFRRSSKSDSRGSTAHWPQACDGRWSYGKLVLCVLLVCSLACASSVSLADEQMPPLVLGVEDSWPPYSNKQGEGVSKQIVIAAFSAVGQEVHFVVLPYARVLRDVESGNLDGGFNVTRQASTVERFVFGETPILQAQASFYYSPASPLQLESHSVIADGSRVGMILGYEYGDAYEKHRHRFKEIRVGQQSQIVRMLIAGRLDLAIMFDEVARQTLLDMELPHNAISKGGLNHRSDIYVVFSKNNPFSSKHAQKLDQGMKIIKASGQYADIINQHSY